VYNFVIVAAGRSLAMKLVETFARPLGDLLHKESMFTSRTPAMLQVLSGLFQSRTRFDLELGYSGFMLEENGTDIVLFS